MGAGLGWRVLADAEPIAPKAEEDEDEEDEDEEDDGRTSKAPIPYAKTQPDVRLTRITKYNVFCPTCAPEVDEVEAEQALSEDFEVDKLEFPDAIETQLPLALVATMEAEAPGISLATITQVDGGTGVYAEGDEVLDDVELLAVDLGIVYLRTATRVEYLRLSSDEPRKPKLTPAKDDKGKDDDATKPRSKNEIPGASDSIKCSGMSCTVDRAFVQQLLGNPALLTGQGGARPYARDDLKGFRLSRVRSGTVPRLLGLRTGDVITGINGQPLDSLDSAMALYARLRNASHLTVDLVRNRTGTRQELRLDITIQ